jgi:hypothetical protein
MSEVLLARSLFSPERSRSAPVFDAGGVALPPVTWKTPSYETFYEAITPNSKTDRRKLKAREVDLIDIQARRELLVEVDRHLLQGLQAWKPFQHYKRWYDSPVRKNTEQINIGGYTFDGVQFEPVTLFSERIDEVFITGVFDATFGPNSGLSAWFDRDSNTEDWVLPPSGLDGLITKSLTRLLPQVRTRVQLLNTLFELKDIVYLKSTIARLRTLGHRIASKGPVGTLREVAKSAADVFLSYKFGIEPLIRDIESIHKALVDSLGRMRRLMQFDGVPQVTRYRRDLRENEGYSIGQSTVNAVYTADITPRSYWVESDPTDILVHVDDGNIVVTTYFEITNVKEQFSAQLRFIARWSETQHRYVEQLGLIDALGLSWNPKHIWDAIPFSFVIDWVVKVGDFLDQFGKGALDPVLDVIDYSWSINKERSVQLSAKFGDKVVTYPLLRESAYRRQPSTANMNALITSSLSSNEVRLASALVIVRRKKLTKPRNRRRLKRR